MKPLKKEIKRCKLLKKEIKRWKNWKKKLIDETFKKRN